MASRKSSRGTGGSPSPGSKRETKHGGSRNGKKDGFSGSSFFTWFMVIALLGVWTSVAVVWFELVDYEEVLGKLGIYDADGDGDFDVEDAKVLLGLKERSVPAQPASPEPEESIQPDEKPYVESEHENADVQLEEEIQSLVHEDLHSQPGERHEDAGESVNDQWQAEEEIHGETFEAPATDDLLQGLESEVPEAYEAPDSDQKDAELGADDLEAVDLGAVEAELYETPGDSELALEDAMEQDTAAEDIPEEVNEATEPDEVIEEFDVDKEPPVESKQTEDDVATEPEESETPAQAEDYLNDDAVDT